MKTNEIEKVIENMEEEMNLSLALLERQGEEMTREVDSYLTDAKENAKDAKDEADTAKSSADSAYDSADSAIDRIRDAEEQLKELNSQIETLTKETRARFDKMKQLVIDITEAAQEETITEFLKARKETIRTFLRLVEEL